jgi:hypothetical protein
LERGGLFFSQERPSITHSHFIAGKEKFQDIRGSFLSDFFGGCGVNDILALGRIHVLLRITALQTQQL